MFGRHTSPDGDAVAAAQKRLDALAAQFNTGPQADPSSQSPTRPPGRTHPELDTVQDGPDRRDHGDDVGAAEPHQTRSDDDLGGRVAQVKGGRHAARRSAVHEYGRWDITTYHVTLAALTVAVLIAVTAWWVLRGIPEQSVITSERTLPSSASVTTATDPLKPTPSDGDPSVTTSPVLGGSTSSTMGESVVVDVAGKVRRPGIVELPVGSRTVDALESAGGVRPGVDTASLNLARVLVDGEQIVVGLEVPPMNPAGGATGTPSSSELLAMVDLNAATAAQLETLPGIGPVTAAAILAWRSENGAFTTVDELLEVSGIGDATLAEIEAHVYV